MKRLFPLILLVFLPCSLHAADLHRWLVATRGGVERASVLSDLSGASPRRLVSFATVAGFAADLTDDEAKSLEKSRQVRFVERDREVQLLGTEDGVRIQQQVPYGVNVIDAPQVWGRTRGNGIRVAILDSGIDMLHPDLVQSYRGGWNAISTGAPPVDDNGHGTHVAGTIAAADNDIGFVGVAPDVGIYAVKVLKANGKGTTETVIAGVEWAVQHQMNIITLSLGSTIPSDLEREAMDAAAAAGVLIIAAAGNDATSMLSYPAAYPSVVAVGAVGPDNLIASFSDGGTGLALVAPGVDVYSTFPRGTGRLTEISEGSLTVIAKALGGSAMTTAQGRVIDCGFGRAGEFPPSVRGQIALVRRSATVSFGDSTRSAMAAGAVAVVIANDGPGLFSDSLDGAVLSGFDRWPLVLCVSQEDGEKLLASRDIATEINRIDDYAMMSGTSMAAPHVAGAAALAWSARPGATASEVRSALTSTARDLGDPGWDAVYGYGLVDALAAAQSLAPNLFAPSSAPLPRPLTPLIH